MVYRRRRRVQRRPRNRKRWYVNASATLPFLGKTAFSAGNKRAIRRAVESIDETKVVSTTINNASMTAYVIKTWNIGSQIPQGTTGGSRLGDKIHLKKVLAKIQWDVNFANLPANVDTASCRVMVIRHEKGLLETVNGVLGSGIGASDVFYDTTYPHISTVDYNKAKIICDKHFDFKNHSGGGNLGKETIIKEFSCNLNKLYTYRTGTQSSRDESFYLLFIPYCAGGTTGVTAVFDQINAFTIITFKDA